MLTIIVRGTSKSISCGASPMRRSMQRYFGITVSDAILNSFLKHNAHIYVNSTFVTCSNEESDIMIISRKIGDETH